MREGKDVHQSGHGCPGLGFASAFWVCLHRQVKLAACAFALLFPFIAFLPAAHADTVDYVYDELGRLVGAVDSSGASARYVYDALGNVTSIERNAAGTVSILEFTPNSGPVGETVTVSGSGFSTTPANNTVTVNGAAATVTSATATRLVITIPAGATTGRIAVTTTAGTATSFSDFVVTTANAGAPTITGFTPTSGTAGTAVTITGTNFDPTPGAIKIEFNQTFAVVGSSTSTSLGTLVPANASSGKIRVLTPLGSAASADDFIIPPAGINATDIVDRKRIVANGSSQSININATNKLGLLLFEGNRGDFMSLDLPVFSPNPTSSTVLYEVYSPDGTKLAYGFVSASLRTISIPRLQWTGTHSLYFKSGTATVNLTAALVLDPAIITDGASVARNHDFSGQSTRSTFTATAGQSLGLGISGGTWTPTSGTYAVFIYQPDGLVLGGSGKICYASSGDCDFNLVNLPATGTYSIEVSPSNGTTGGYTATLSSEAMGTLTPGTPFNLSLSRAGQNGRLSFSGTAGQSVGIEVAGFVTTPAGKTASITVYKPDGTTLALGGATSSNSGGFIYLANLPVTGTYTVFIDPSLGATGTMQVTLDPGLPLEIDGPPITATWTIAGETPRLTFTGTAGQNLGLGISGFTLNPSASTYATVFIYKPDGTALGGGGSTCYVSGGACDYNLNLPASGAYSVVVLPQNGATGSFTTTLSNELTATLTTGVPYNLNLSRLGQTARLTFSGAVGDSVGIEVAGFTTAPAGKTASIKVYKPDGTLLTSGAAATSVSGSFLNLASLPATGTYAVVIDPVAGTTATMQVTLDPGTPLVIDGPSVNTTLTTAGETARLTFAGTAGQNLGLGISALTLAPTTSTSLVTVYKPDGLYLTYTYCYVSTSGCSLNLTNLPVTGTYSVVVTPYQGGTGSFTAALSSDVTASLTAGTAYNLNLSRVGQNGRLTFSGTAGTNRTLTFASIATVPAGKTVSFTVYRPDGTYLSAASTSGSSTSLSLTALPTTGTYTVFIDPSSFPTTATMTVTVSP